MNINLKDLKSRFDSFLDLGIDLPTDDLLSVVITKSFSDKQIEISTRLLDYIIKNIDRSYENVFKFIKEIQKANSRIKFNKIVQSKSLGIAYIIK